LAEEWRRDDAARALQNREDTLLVDGTLTGRNAECRTAELRLLTTAERGKLAGQERAVDRSRLSLHHLQA
jgi:hypothetical protein